MVEENGTVIHSDADRLIVAVVQSSACQSCRARQGCGQAVLSGLGDAETQLAKNHFELTPHTDIQAGDQVRLGIAEDSLSLAAAWMYLWPLLAAFIGLFGGASLSVSEGWQLMFAVLGGSAAVAVTRMRFKRPQQRWEPQILAVHSNVKAQSSSLSAPVVEP
ncbi:hypothetical protein BGP77_09195 [Saccharospirillum sp. MSK14-1]|uniref:SoxR reducing system RseC family protein n=1 Tax=Saccharospirillum sp. MSK14-1 TaxID=1897632 RepID=UPI000D41BB18|nr:SoxR reducing system RseC family protein [Saccharospirillum sp. MSK14-1]PTY38922.1 hypothetical protein BGP77_09195 [Saccharospirillum sp. MSK14-1]